MANVLPDDAAGLAAVYSAMAAELESYLDQDGLYRNLVVQTPGRTFKPVMTLGLMWDASDSVASKLGELADEDRAVVAAAGAQIDAVRVARGAAYDAKLTREIASLLDSWSWYLDSCEHGDDDCVGNYPVESWIRTRLENLMARAAVDGLNTAAAADRLAGLDTRLRALLKPGPFVGGDPQDSGARPPEKYWWLYGRPGRL